MKHSFFTEEQGQFILDNYLDKTYDWIGEQLGGYTRGQIGKWLYSHGYKKQKNDHSSMYTQEQQEYIRAHYQTMSYKEIADAIDSTTRQVTGWIANHCWTKLREYDKRYFQNIDSSDKAYWLGFLYADGCVQYHNISHDRGGGDYKVDINLQLGDEGHLRKFINRVGGDHKLTYVDQERYVAGFNKLTHAQVVCLRLYAKQMCQDLIAHGVVPNKTYSDIYPKQEEFFLDFLRGYIDGDGCIYNHPQNKYMYVDITSANQFVLQHIKEKLWNDYKIRSSVRQQRELKYRIVIFERHGMKLLNLMYQDPNAERLDRKYEKYLQVRLSHPEMAG